MKSNSKGHRIRLTVLFSSFHCTFFLLLGRLPERVVSVVEAGVVIAAALESEAGEAMGVNGLADI